MATVRGVFYCPWRHVDFGQLAAHLDQHFVNLVSLQRVGNGWYGRAYYPSNVKPRALPPGEDLLAGALTAFHQFGIQVRAHLAVGNDPAVAAEHPEWLSVRRDGVKCKAPDAWKSGTYVHLCPANPAYHEYLLRVVEEISAGYDIDGVDLDYIRYPFTPSGFACYCDSCTGAYKGQTGVDPIGIEPGGTGWAEWVEWRAQQVTALVRRIGETMKSNRPRATLMAYIAAWYSEGVDRSEIAKIKERFGQDIPALAAYCDSFAPMLYHNYPHEPFTIVQSVGWVGVLTRHIVAAGGKPVWTATQVSPRDVTPLTARLAIELAMTGGAEGAILFPYGSIQSAPGDEIWGEVDKAFGAMARLVTSSQPN